MGAGRASELVVVTEEELEMMPKLEHLEIGRRISLEPLTPRSLAKAYVGALEPFHIAQVELPVYGVPYDC